MSVRLFLTIALLIPLTWAAQGQVSSNMILHANWDDNNLPSKSGGFTYNEVWGYAANNREYAILGSLVGTIFIDVTNPRQPVEVARINGGYPNSLWRDFKTYGNYAYGVADESAPSSRSGLQVFDLSNLPNGVTKVYDSFAYFERAHNIFIDERSGRLYAVGVNVSNVDMVILDLVARPDSPALIANLRLPGGYIHDVYVRGDTAFCSHGYNGLYIYDLTDPTLPSATTPLGIFYNYPNSGYNHSSWLTPDRETLVFADETHNRHLKLLDVSDMSNLSIISTVKSTLLAPTYTNSIAHNPFVKDDLLFISYYHDGVQVFDITDRAAPYRLAYYDTEPLNTTYNGYTGCWGVYPYLPSGIILASDVRNGLFVLEVQNRVLSAGQVLLEANPGPEGVTLSWELGERENFALLEVERAGKAGHFQSLAAVESEAGKTHYEVLDGHPLPGLGLYRLAMTDLLGQRHYSPQVEVRIPVEPDLLQVYPNPANAGQPLRLRLYTAKTESVEGQLFDLHGRMIRRQTWQTSGGWLDATWSLDNLAPGMYRLWVYSENKGYSRALLLR